MAVKARDLQQCHGLLGLKELQLNKLGEDMGAVESKLRAKEEEVKLCYPLITSYHNLLMAYFDRRGGGVCEGDQVPGAENP